MAVCLQAKLSDFSVDVTAYAVPHHNSSRMWSFAGRRVPGSLQGKACTLFQAVACHDAAFIIDTQNCVCRSPRGFCRSMEQCVSETHQSQR